MMKKPVVAVVAFVGLVSACSPLSEPDRGSLGNGEPHLESCFRAVAEGTVEEAKSCLGSVTDVNFEIPERLIKEMTRPFVEHLNKRLKGKKVGKWIVPRDWAFRFEVGLSAALKGITMAHVAVIRGDLAILRVLHRFGVDFDASSQSGLRPLMLAAGTGRLVATEWLLGRVDLDARTREGETALHYALLAGSDPVVELLVRRGADVNAHNSRATTPLDVARMTGNIEMEKLLQRVGAKCSTMCG